MADDIKTENYKKNVKRLVADWRKEMEPFFKELDPIIAELRQLEVKQVAARAKKPSLMGMRGGGDAGDGGKKMEDLQKKAREIQHQMEKSTFDFRRDLGLQPGKDKLDKSELEKLGAVVKDIVEDGIPIGKYVRIPVGDLDFNFKTMTPTAASITFKFEF
jgi:hypothetical protein